MAKIKYHVRKLEMLPDVSRVRTDVVIIDNVCYSVEEKIDDKYPGLSQGREMAEVREYTHGLIGKIKPNELTLDIEIEKS